MKKRHSFSGYRPYSLEEICTASIMQFHGKKQQLKNSIEMINHFGGQLANTVILYPACGDYICCFSTYALLF